MTFLVPSLELSSIKSKVGPISGLLTCGLLCSLWSIDSGGGGGDYGLLNSNKEMSYLHVICKSGRSTFDFTRVELHFM